MKKFSVLLVTLLSLVTLVACGSPEASKLTSSSTTQQTDITGQVTLILQTEDESKKKSVDIKEGYTVMDVLKDVYDVKENGGFITEIDGLSQDEAKGIYWMFDVNGKLGEKAADQLEVKKGDEIKFYQQQYE